MLSIILQPIPRQQFTVTLDGSLFDITLIAVQDMTYATILRDGITIVSGARCVSGFPILTSKSMLGSAGNFSFYTPNNENPWWENFSITHHLLYVTALELANGTV